MFRSKDEFGLDGKSSTGIEMRSVQGVDAMPCILEGFLH